MNPFGFRILLPTLLFLLLMATGCTHRRKVAFTNPASPGAGTPLPLRAAMVVPPEIADFRYETKAMGDTWIYEFGPALRQYIDYVSQHGFAGAVQFPTREAAANQADVVITVDSPKVENTMPVWAWDKRQFLLRLRWTASDGAGVHPLWTKTIEGHGEAPAGNVFSWASNERELMQLLFTDLTTQTYEAMTSADEIRASVGSAGRPSGP